jgi:N-acyl-D-amino-acid deacylase
MKAFKLGMVLWLLAAPIAVAQQYDVLIRNGRVVDGSGNPWVYADVGIMGDRIAFVGRAAENVTAKRTIDAKGLVVAPGFIDMLGHSEMNLLIDRTGFSKITQGITTEITGEGGSVAPITQPILDDMKDFLTHYKLTVDWKSFDEYFQQLHKEKPALNLGTFVGATQVREAVIGQADRAPTPEELAQMEEMVGDAMYDGAMGLSTSLIYPPAFFAKTEELVALAKVAARHGGIYASHMRNEGDHIEQALEEAFRIGREANIPVEIWHLKVAHRQNWGRMKDVLAKIEQARASGLDVTADQYPYVAGATSLGASIPPKYHDGGTDALLARLKDPAQRAAIRRDLEQGGAGDFENFWRGAGPEGILVISVRPNEYKKYEGKRIAEIAKLENKDPLDALLDLVLATRNQVGAGYFIMSEDDVRLAMQQPWVAVNTDYGAVNITGPLSESKSHPRAFGTFPRILGKYVRELKLLPLEQAVRKFTSLAAQRVKLNDRGLVRMGYFADITIFDAERVNDVATFEDPNRPSVGIEYVFVNGVLTLERGKMTGATGGRPLRGPGYIARRFSPEGLPMRGGIEGVVTDAQGWPMLRTEVSLLDADGKVLGTATTQKDGKYQVLYELPCMGCRVRAVRMGFGTQERSVDYNGTNTLWFGFVMRKAASR